MQAMRREVGEANGVAQRLGIMVRCAPDYDLRPTVDIKLYSQVGSPSLYRLCTARIWSPLGIPVST